MLLHFGAEIRAANMQATPRGSGLLPLLWHPETLGRTQFPTQDSPLLSLCPIIIPPTVLGVIRLTYDDGFEPPYFVTDNGRQNRKPGHSSRFTGNREPPNHGLHLLI